MRRRVDPDALRLSIRLDKASQNIPNIRAHLNDQRGHLSALRVAGGDTRPGTSHADPVARLVLELERIDYREGLIDDALKSIEVGINLLDKACRDAIAHRAPHDLPPPPTDPVCYVAGCHDYVGSYRLANGTIHYRMGGEYGGLCDRHRMTAIRERRP